MRTTISLVLVGAFFLVNAQRAKFQDPELSFSFRKPPSWEIFDNGYMIKVSPTAKDTSAIYLTITYFSPPQPVEGFSSDLDIPMLIPESSVADRFENFPQSKESIKLFNKQTKWRRSEGTSLELRFYSTLYLGQHWEIIAAAPKERYYEYENGFVKMIKSIRAKRKSN